MSEQHQQFTRFTRSITNLKSTTIESLILQKKKRIQKSAMASTKNGGVSFDPSQIKNVIIGEENEGKMRNMVGHDLNDQLSSQSDQDYQSVLQNQVRSIQKFDGCGDGEQWVKNVLERFDSLQLTSIERNDLVPDILTGEAMMWYVKQQEHMTTFMSFMKKFIQHYGNKELDQGKLTSSSGYSNQTNGLEKTDYKDIAIDSLRNQMLLNNLEKLPKFTGKSKQNVSKWLREIKQAMHIFKLTDDEKLFFISVCLEADARDWFFDNNHLFVTWSVFIQRLTDTFESSGKGDISFNRLRHYEQGINQDVRQYYFEIMKLFKEANPLMDETTKLKYLKDGLKPSLRFDVLLKNPQTPEEFLEYAQKVEELKSLDEKQDVTDWTTNKSPSFPLPSNTNNKRINSPQSNRSYNSQQNKNDSTYYANNSNNGNSSYRRTNAIRSQDQRDHHIPKPPYRCYKCGADDHFIHDCPHFQ